ncbi:MAG: type II toxin-antitoxin system HicA family toxin [Phycisphaeraceae bacterium]|nr:type II toxin-antitoxin system HicA family toxin [Phycisphaeraceae bacterium]
MPYTARQIVAKLQRAGFVQTRQTGSHLFFRHADGRQTFVAMHRGDVPIGTLRKILKQTGLTEEQFRTL